MPIDDWAAGNVSGGMLDNNLLRIAGENRVLVIYGNGVVVPNKNWALKNPSR